MGNTMSRIKSILVIAIFCCTTATVFAQDTVYWSDPYESVRNSVIDKVESANGKRYVVRRNLSGRYAYLEVFDKNNRQLGARRIDLKYESKLRDYEGIYFMGDKIYLLSSYHNQAKAKHFLFYQEINDKIELSELDLLADMEAKRLAKTGKFSITLSEDREKMMVVKEIGVKKRDKKAISISIFDKELNRLWRKKITMRYKNKDYEIVQFSIGNNGNIFILGDVEVKGKNSNTFSLLTYTDSGEEKKEFKFSLRDKYLSNLTSKLNKKDSTLLVVGFYSNKSNGNTRGIFLSKIDLDRQEVLFKTQKEFDFDTRTKDLSDRKRQRASRNEQEVELKNYYLKDVVLRDDGGAILFSEKINIRVMTPNQFGFSPFNRFGNVFDPFGQRMNGNNVQYFYEDILVTNLGPDGTIYWNTNIPKYQSSLNDNGVFSSYFSAVTPDRIYLFFSDQLENLSNFNDPFSWVRGNRFFRNNSGVFVMTALSADGTYEMYPLWQSDVQRNVIPIPSVSKQTGKYEITLYGANSRVFQLGKVYLPNPN